MFKLNNDDARTTSMAYKKVCRYYARVDVNFYKIHLPRPSNFRQLSSSIFLSLSHLSGWRQLWTTPKQVSYKVLWYKHEAIALKFTWRAPANNYLFKVNNRHSKKK